MITDIERRIEEYKETYGMWDIGRVPGEERGYVVYITTERFLATSFVGQDKEGEEPYFGNMKETLYTDIFGNKEIMSTGARYGASISEENFNNYATNQSLLWNTGNLLGGFIIEEIDSPGTVVGYQDISDNNKDVLEPGEGELSYLFSKKYHCSKDFQGVGSECVGAFVLGWAQLLADSKYKINVKYNRKKEKYVGNALDGLYAHCFEANIGSKKILEKYGFKKISGNEYYLDLMGGNESYMDIEGSQNM